MKNKALIFTILLIQLVASKLSLFTLNEVIENLSEDIGEQAFLLKSSILNPVFGYLLETTGALGNLRFLSPGLRVTESLNGRDFSKDSSEDPSIQLFLELFPSPTGTLNHIRTSKYNFGYMFRENKKEGIKLLAEIFLKILREEAYVEESDETTIESFEKVKKLLLNNQVGNLTYIFNFRLIKLMTIHAFIMNALDSENDLEEYLILILEGLEEGESIETYDENCDILGQVLKIQQDFKSFPFSELNKPPSNVSIPIYNRKKDEFILSKPFSDCADILLLNICNALFYDPHNCCYSIKHLNPNSDLAKFYQKHSQLFTTTDDIRNDWSKVVQGLNDFPITTQNKYKLNKIMYTKEKRNEISTGIINMMNILIHICNIDHGKFWADFDGKNIESKLINLFEILKPKFPGQIFEAWNLPESYSEFKSKERIDFEGIFFLGFYQPNKTKILLKVFHNAQHSEMNLVDYQKPEAYFSKSTDQTQDNECLPVFLLRNYTSIAYNEPNATEKLDIFSKLLFTGSAENINQMLEMLLNICEVLIEEEVFSFQTYENDDIKIMRFDLLLDILENILSLVNAGNRETQILFIPFLFSAEKLTEDQIILSWIKSFYIQRIDVYKLWEERILNLDCREMKFDLSEMPTNKIPALFETLKKCKMLDSLSLFGINRSQSQIIAKELSQMPNLKSLCLSNNNLKLQGIKCFVDAFSNLKELIHLDLSNNSLDIEGAKYLSIGLEKLTNLTSLNLSGNSIQLEGTKYIANALKQLSRLEILDISRNTIQIKGAKLIADEVTKFPKFTSLNLAGNSLDSDGSETFAGLLSNLTNLTSLDLSGNYLGCLNLNMISLELRKLTKLTSICLSHSKLGQKMLESVLFALQNMKNLTNLDLSMNLFGIHEIQLICNAIKNITQLKTLNLSGNSLDYQGAILLSKVLNKLKKLVCLDISYNNLDSKSVLTIFNAIEKSSNLQKLDFTDNESIDKETKAFLLEKTKKSRNNQILKFN